VIALDKATHTRVNAAQRALDAKAMTPRANIRANANILRAEKAASPKVIDAAEKRR
jgi:hypothetical protein